jgi:signal transduction histidine kinase
MPARPYRESRQEASPVARGMSAGAVALVVTGASLAWAVFDAPRSADKLVAAGGSAAAVVIVVAVAMAAYYARAARRFRAEGSSSVLAADRMVAELDRLAGETLPSVVRRVRDGAESRAVLRGAQVDTPAVRRLLAAVVDEIAVAVRREAEAAAAGAAIEAATARAAIEAATAQAAIEAATAQAAIEAEVQSLARETLPAVVREIRDGQSMDLVLDGVSHPGSSSLSELIDTVVSEVAIAERRGAAAMAACASAAARIQAQSTRMLAELREMENRHGGNNKVFADLMELDHRVSQLGRLADSIALLAGGRSGRRWTRPIPMESILRGAMSRIDAYQRIRLHSTSTAAVVGYAAEGVMHALAELMDNAVAFSTHGSEVHVYVEDEGVGVIVTIEDSGIGMRNRERGRAEALIAQPFNLATLPGTRLGLAVVGRVADRYGLSVNFRPSSRGGTGVVVMIPRQLIAQQHERTATDGRISNEESGQTPRFVPVQEKAGEIAEEDGKVIGSAGDDDELPVRPRGYTLASATNDRRESPMRPVPGQDRDAGARFAAFREAGERARNALSAQEDGTA